MREKVRRWWPPAVIVVVTAAAGGLVWAVWRAQNRSDLSTFGGFAVAVIVPVASLVAYLTKVRSLAGAGLDRPLDEIADALAGAVMDQLGQQ